MTDGIRTDKLLTFRGTLWHVVTLRGQARACCACHKPVFRGDTAWRPIGESVRVKRYERLCAACGEIGK